MTTTNEINWKLVSEVKASQRRRQVLAALAEQPRMNSELADELGVSTVWARKQVKWLQQHDLVEDLTESKHNYKIYAATTEGEQVAEVL